MTTQISLLLEPLTLYLLQQHKNHSPCHPFQPPASQFQALHDIVSEAGHLALCIRLSPDIFHFVSERPGEPFNNETQFCLDLKEFTDSKAAVVAAQGVAAKGSKTAYGGSESDFVTSEGSPAGTAENAPLYPAHRALVKIAAWPSIKRYKRGNGVTGGEYSGFRIFDICPAGVICYWGVEKRDRDEEFRKRAEREGVGKVGGFVKGRKGFFGVKRGFGEGIGVTPKA
jgi:hypothetical protein